MYDNLLPDLLLGCTIALRLDSLVAIFVGMVAGILIGAIPGIGGSVGVAQREARFEAIRNMKALGIKLVASSDAGMKRTYPSDFALLLDMMVSQLGMSPLEAIKAATRTAAEARDIAAEVGTIEAGKRADLLLVNGTPLEDICALRRVDQVIRNGKAIVPESGLVHPN